MVRSRKKVPIETAEIIIQRTDELQSLKDITSSANKAIGLSKYQAAQVKGKTLGQIHNEFTGHQVNSESTAPSYNLDDVNLEDLFSSDDAA